MELTNDEIQGMKAYFYRTFLLSLFCVIGQFAAVAVEIHVSPEGNDGFPGTKEMPFATINRAQKEVRKLKSSRDSSCITVYLHQGRYELTAPVVFGAEDSGSETQPVVYRAFPGEEPVFSGAHAVKGWTNISEAVDGVNKAAIDHLWTAKVPAGISFSTLQIQGKIYYRSIWPNTDAWEEWPVAVCEGETLTLPDELRFKLPNSTDVEINYLPTPYTKWINLFNTITKMDGSVIRLEKPILKIGILVPTKKIPVRIENTLEGIDRPGEWCLNRETGTIYLWPPEGVADFTNQVYAVRVNQLFVLDGSPDRPVEYLSFEGLSMEMAQTGIQINSARKCSFLSCRIESMEGTGFDANDVRDCVIENCLIAFCGRNGLSIGKEVDGREMSLSSINRRNRIEHNEVHHCGQIHWQSRGITLYMASDNQIRENYVHDVSYAGIFVGGRRFYLLKSDLAKMGKTTQDGIPEEDMTIYGLKRYVPGNNRIENNVVHDAMMNLDDGGAIYCHASHHNMLKNNVIFRLHGGMAMGMYFDDDEMFSTMDNNLVFSREGEPSARFAIHIHDNACNYVQRNIITMADRKPISTLHSYGGHVITHNVFIVRKDGGDQGELKRNGGRYDDLKWDAGQPIMDNNLYWSLDGGKTAFEYLKVRQEMGFDLNSSVKDPAFEDVLNGRFAFPTSSPVCQMGIEPIDTSEVGVRSSYLSVQTATKKILNFY